VLSCVPRGFEICKVVDAKPVSARILVLYLCMCYVLHCPLTVQENRTVFSCTSTLFSHPYFFKSYINGIFLYIFFDTVYVRIKKCIYTKRGNVYSTKTRRKHLLHKNQEEMSTPQKPDCIMQAPSYVGYI